MGCCGQSRALLRAAQPTPAVLVRPAPPPPRPNAAPPPAPQPTATGRSAVGLRYLEKQPVRVRGTVTGQMYHFSEGSSVRWVDARDAAALLRTRYFRRAV